MISPAINIGSSNPVDSGPGTAKAMRGTTKIPRPPIDVLENPMKTADSAWDAMEQTAIHGNIASKSDIEVGARSLEVGIWGAYKNVMINMTDIKDEAYKKETIQIAEGIKNRAKNMCDKVINILDKR